LFEKRGSGRKAKEEKIRGDMRKRKKKRKQKNIGFSEIATEFYRGKIL
jgi:hypothetical protein